MTVTIGMGAFVYEYRGDWAELPAGKSFQAPSAVAVDSHDRVYVFQRRGPPVLVFDREGRLLAEWPRRDGELEDAHLIYVGPDDGVYLTDRDSHQVLKYTSDGEMLMALGTRHQAALQAPFNHPSDIAVAPTGEIYISDGYGNSSVHRFSSEGGYIASFGTPGSGPGQFRVPHSIRIAQDGRVYVCDRENDRVQVFSESGEFLDQWTDFKSPMGIHIDANQIVYVTDQVPRLSILNLEGELLARGRTFEFGHNVYSDSNGDLYAVDVANQRVQKFVKIR
uniref:Putative NHL repeat protein n=1 Tax=uncultured marine microorganism HF4000_010I05 TaxID=455517 RepID=B3T1L6_9ZZZZ|nr:putative NHL repeat protein [uncultured marine microorganism HF4000_010I05]